MAKAESGHGGLPLHYMHLDGVWLGAGATKGLR